MFDIIAKVFFFFSISIFYVRKIKKKSSSFLVFLQVVRNVKIGMLDLMPLYLNFTCSHLSWLDHSVTVLECG